MIQPVSATAVLPCVGIHLDDLILAGALPALRMGAQESPARPADLAPGRPPLSDEEDDDGPHDAADDDEDEEDEDEDEDEDDTDEDEDGDDDDEGEEDDEEDEEDEDGEDDDEEDEDEDEDEEEKEEK
jgi:hypothetical protein